VMEFGAQFLSPELLDNLVTIVFACVNRDPAEMMRGVLNLPLDSYFVAKSAVVGGKRQGRRESMGGGAAANLQAKAQMAAASMMSSHSQAQGMVRKSVYVCLCVHICVCMHTRSYISLYTHTHTQIPEKMFGVDRNKILQALTSLLSGANVKKDAKASETTALLPKAEAVKVIVDMIASMSGNQLGSGENSNNAILRDALIGGLLGSFDFSGMMLCVGVYVWECMCGSVCV
jgi:hypothetical protein